MPIGTTRDKVLYGIGKKRGLRHRFTRWRIVIGIAATLLVALLPVLGILRFDFWGGQHVLMGEVVDLPTAAKAFAYPFLGVNILIIVASRFTGRYLCGFACPYGAMARLREWMRFGASEPLPRAIAEASMLGISSLLAAVVFSFWVDWAVFLEGSGLAKALSLSFLLGMAGGLYGLVRYLGMGFCRGWCPSGVYFAILGPDSVNGIEFAHEENCTECGACEMVCPVDLKPRDMSGGEHRESIGFYVDGMSNFSNCIRCGDCVNVCEGMTDRYQKETPLRMGWLPEGARDSTVRVEPDAESEEASSPVS